MLIEGFHGNTMRSTGPNVSSLPVGDQQRVIGAWAGVQVWAASLAYPLIGSICGVDARGEPIIGRVADFVLDGNPRTGPFSSAIDYFNSLADFVCSIPECQGPGPQSDDDDVTSAGGSACPTPEQSS